MKYEHEKTGLAAFLLSLLGVATLGIAAIPAMACAIISKRQAELMGEKTDGFATAAIVVSGFIFALWGLALLGVTAFGLGVTTKIPQIGMDELRQLIFATASITLLVASGMLFLRLRRQGRLRRLAGR